MLVEPTSDREASTEPDIALASAFFDDELSRDWYTAEDLTTLGRSGAALALVVTVREPATTAPASDGTQVAVVARWRASRRADGEQALTG